jgi:hypothetical protein
MRVLLPGCLILATFLAAAPETSAQSNIIPPPTSEDWARLAKLPDWSGTWNPSVRGQNEEIQKSPTPWTPKAAAQIAKMAADEAAGKPHPLFVDCLPQGMPSWMLITHNAIEFLFTPGRVTILGESDGNKLRRIYTDGRSHPADPDLTFHGHSIGHWEGETLVVDTVGVMPEMLIAITEGLGVPNNGDMRIVERIHLASPEILQFDMEITAPHVLTATWKTSRTYYRQRARNLEIVEGSCLQGRYLSEIDKDGNAVFVPVPDDYARGDPLWRNSEEKPHSFESFGRRPGSGSSGRHDVGAPFDSHVRHLQKSLDYGHNQNRSMDQSPCHGLGL